MKFFLILFIMLSPCTFPQNLTMLYKDNLPPAVFKNETYSEQVRATMEAYSDINPELIYYYINYLNEKLGETSGNDYFYKNFTDIKKLYRHRFNNYILNLQKDILGKNAGDRLTGLCADYLDDYLDDEIKFKNKIDLDSKTDLNLRDFFVVKYYTRDIGMKYEKSEKYDVIRRAVEQKRISAYKEMMINPVSYSKKDLQSLVLDLHIMQDDQTVDPSIIILNVLKHYYSNDNMFSKIEIAAGYSFQSDYMFMADGSYDTPLYVPSAIKRKFLMNSLLLSLRYKINLSEYLGSFNFFNIRLSAGYGLINSSLTGEKYGFWNTNVDGISNRSEIFDFAVNDIKLKSAEFVGADVTMPVLFYKESVSLDIGAGMSLRFTNYELTYDYEYRKFDSEFTGPKIIETESGSASNKGMTSTTFKYYPEVLFSVYLSSLYTLHLMTTLRTTSIEFGFNF